MKRFLLILFVGLIGLINFGYCANVGNLITYLGDENTVTVSNRSSYTIYNVSDEEYLDGTTICIEYTATDNFAIGSNGATSENYYTVRVPKLGQYVCLVPYIGGINLINPWTSGPITFTYKVFKLNALLSTDIPIMTTLECQTEYNLIPISSIDQNYCVNNNLCPSQGDCPDIPGDYTGDLIYSNIYINNILHPGRQNIFINIPDYITWDYSQNEVDFNVYVGSGYDVDYINSIVDINSYRPTSEDFTNVFVSGLTLVFPYIFVALLILFIWKLVKRIFK